MKKYNPVQYIFKIRENILSGPKQKIRQVPFGQILLEGLQNGGSKIALVNAATGDKLTYKELLERSISLAQHLKHLGLKKQDAISICSENSIIYSIPIISAIYLGVIVTPLNYSYTERELEHALNISKSKIIFCASGLVDTFINISKKQKFIEKIIVMNKCDKLPNSVLRLDDLIHSQKMDNFHVAQAKQNDVTAIMYSSGTTGLAKGVMLTNAGFVSVLQYIQHPKYGGYSSEKIQLGLLPFFHVFGYINLLCTIITNSKLVNLTKFEEHLFLQTIQNYKITSIALVPPLVIFLSKSPLVDQYDLSSLKEILSGAAPLKKDVQDLIKKRLNVYIRQGYGLTESTFTVTLQPLHLSHTGSVGCLVPEIECKVIDVKTGKSLKSNQCGELLFRGPQIMKGYVQNPKATAETIDADGWLHTGDIGYYDENQYFYIVDRYKELIKYKAYQVPPAEIEGIILTLSDVLDCAVVGKPNEEAGELPCAFVVKKPNSTITEKQIYDHVAQNVSYHKRLHGGIIFIDSIPKNPSGKLLRRVLRERIKTISES